MCVTCVNGSELTTDTAMYRGIEGRGDATASEKGKERTFRVVYASLGGCTGPAIGDFR